MIARLSAIITTIKTFAYTHTALRMLCYVAIVLALLLYWLYFGGEEISFVYNAF